VGSAGARPAGETQNHVLKTNNRTLIEPRRAGRRMTAPAAPGPRAGRRSAMGADRPDAFRRPIQPGEQPRATGASRPQM